ncbi:hypothetical protein C6501_06360 [Candidatus Poribacteria bacterium]|nr:MAG: hypothetical protein C6501_06360 [Candidatus Poribacteria bacterium]
MSQDFDIYFEDILEAIERIQEYVQDVTRETFETDRMRIDAVIRNLEVIGKTVKQVPGSVREKYPSVAWWKIAGLRDVLIHKYFDVNLEIVWGVVQSNIPILQTDFADRNPTDPSGEK